MARSSRTSNPVTLFPFLAVLLCTIGALVLMLVVISAGIRKDAVAIATAKKQSSAQAVASGHPPASRPPAEQTDEPDRSPVPSTPVAAEPTIQQRPIEPLLASDPLPSPIQEAPSRTLAEIADLERVARQLQAEVADRSKQLQSVTVKTYALRKQLDTVKTQQNNLQLEIIRTASQRTKLDQSTEELRVENRQIIEWLDESRKLIDENSRQLVSPLHSIVPYDGQTGTVRRPIIIECVGDVVRFEAEQIEIPIAVLQKFSPEQNPLASGVEALFRYWMAKEQIADPRQQPRKPYALILVRPSGAEAFSSAIFAMDEMVGDFGYELVETEFLYEVPETTADAIRECRAAIEAELRRGPIRSRRVLDPQGPVDIASVARGPVASRGFFRSADFRNRRAVGSADSDESGNGTGTGTGSSTSENEGKDVGEAVAKAAARRREAEMNAAAELAKNLLSGRVAEGASLLQKGPPSSFDAARAAALADAALANAVLTDVLSDAAQADAAGTAKTFGASEPSTSEFKDPLLAFTQEVDGTFDNPSTGRSPFLMPENGGLSNNRLPPETNLPPETGEAERPTGNGTGGSSDVDGKKVGTAGSQGRESVKAQPRRLVDTGGRPALNTGGSANGSDRAERATRGGKENERSDQRSGSGVENSGTAGSGSGATSRQSYGSVAKGMVSPDGTSPTPTLAQSFSSPQPTGAGQGGSPSNGSPGSTPGNSSSTDGSSTGLSGSGSSSGSDSSPVGSGIPTISTRPPSNEIRSLKTQRRWGHSHPDASLGLEKVVEVRVETGRIVVGNQFQVTRTAERSEADVVNLTILTIEHLANEWGWPPPRFYWVPSIELKFEPAEQHLGTLLEAAVKDAGAALE
ncbi:MAG: hypothetical protein HQ518_09015 [Rhodopirellula sp.]|nr:hypothetical protein [Rhodopirellula sp.]